MSVKKRAVTEQLGALKLEMAKCLLRQAAGQELSSSLTSNLMAMDVCKSDNGRYKYVYEMACLCPNCQNMDYDVSWCSRIKQHNRRCVVVVN